MGKKPKIFENKIDKNINNNKVVFDSSKDEIELIKDNDNRIVDKSNNDLSVVDKITRLLNRNGYIFNVSVLIKTKDNEYNTHIASVVNNHIITLDNDIINIDDVIDIKY